MSEQERRTQHPATGDRSHEDCLSLLAEYATAQTLGQQPERRYPVAAAHLAQCAPCRHELAQLLELVDLIYSGELAAVSEMPRIDLSFLSQGAVGKRSDNAPPKPLDDLRHLVVVFTESLLAAVRQPALAAGARGESLFRYTPEPQPPGNLRLTVEVFAVDEAAQQGTIQVLVDLASRSPLEQAGIAVTLTIGEQVFVGQTEATGAVTFTDVPLAGLSEMRVEVQVPSE